MKRQQQYLIAVTIRCTHYPNLKERTIYRIPMESRFVDVVETAKARCELVGELTCNGVEVLGILEPTLFDLHLDLFSVQDVSDSFGSDGVVALRAGGEPAYRVVYHGRVCSPTWTERGPAAAYYSMLLRGQRKPEYA